MSKFEHLILQVRASIPENIDVCVSFVLFNNDEDEIIRAIQQVVVSAVSSHIVIIDNSLPRLNLDFAASSRVTVVHTDENIGYGRGHNIALSASKGKCQYNIVMNTDLKTVGDPISGMINFMDNHPEAGLAMPKVLYPDGSLQRLCRLLPDPTDMIARRLLGSTNWGKAKNNRYEFHDWDYGSVAQFPFLSGCFMTLRRSIIDRIGYFDERYFLYAEDLDLSRRINAVSDTLYNPEQVIIHEYRSKARPSVKRLKYAAVSLTKYFFKWGWFFDHDRDRINKLTIEQFR